MEEVLPNIWIGAGNAVPRDFCRTHGIQLLYHCGGPRLSVGADLANHTTHHSLSNDDKSLLEATGHLATAYKTLAPTLLYCETGNQAAATLVAAFLIRYTGMDWKTAIRILQTKRATAFRPGIWRADFLEKLCTSCHPQSLESL